MVTMSLAEIMERVLHRTNARVFPELTTGLRALVLSLQGTKIPDLHRDSFLNALMNADDAMLVCEVRPLQAILFSELYAASIIDATQIIIEASLSNSLGETVVLEYIQQMVPRNYPGPLIESLPLRINDAVVLFNLLPPEILVDEMDYQTQLDEILTKARFSRPMQQRDCMILDWIVQFHQNRTPIANPLLHQDWTSVQRIIKSAVTVVNFEEVYNDGLSIGTLRRSYLAYGVGEDAAFDEWARLLKDSPNDDGAQVLLLRIQTMRLFYFELYRRHQNGFIKIEHLRGRCGTWIHNGLLMCVKADRSYTTRTRQMDWVRPNSLNGHFGSQRNPTIHPIYEWYIDRSPFFRNNSAASSLLEPRQRHLSTPVLLPPIGTYANHSHAIETVVGEVLHTT